MRILNSIFCPINALCGNLAVYSSELFLERDYTKTAVDYWSLGLLCHEVSHFYFVQSQQLKGEYQSMRVCGSGTVPREGLYQNCGLLVAWTTMS